MHPPDASVSVDRLRPKIAALQDLARGKSTLLAQTHDYPDPDTIAAAMGLTWMMKELSGLEGTVGYGGIIGRAENRAMIKVLGIKLKKTAPADFAKYDLVALLDTQPEVGNHSVPLDRQVDIVVDHHFRRELSGPEPTYFDVGGDFGTTSTKVTELIRASGLVPPTDVATALLYGVKSDTLNLARVTTPSDMAAYLYLLPLADTRLLSEIEHPQVPLEYFRVFNKALNRGKVYGSMIVVDLGQVYTPDLCAELADRLLAVAGIKHALATAWYEDALFMSFRTRSRNKNAGKILHAIVAESGLGGAGGHGPMAGARIPVEGKSPRARRNLRQRVVRELLQAFGEDSRHFERIVNGHDDELAELEASKRKDDEDEKQDSDRPQRSGDPTRSKKPANGSSEMSRSRSGASAPANEPRQET